MPQLGRYKPFLDCIFFLYRNREDAKNGVRSGGTGFLVAIESELNKGRAYIYGVTNWHVACRDGFSVVRINSKEGPPDIFEFDPAEWEFQPNSHDLAVISLPVKMATHRVSYLTENLFLTEAYRSEAAIDVADDVFMIGRFIDYDGIETNTPAVRFGNISILSAPIKQPNGFAGSSVVVDMHSRTGFSGSPVFVFRTPGSYFDEAYDVNGPDFGKTVFRAGHTMRLLGIHWGQFPEKWPIGADATKIQTKEASLITDGAYVEGLSGMTCVIPAMAILEILNMSKLKSHRRQQDIIVADYLKRAGGAPIAESATDENPGSPPPHKAL